MCVETLLRRDLPLSSDPPKTSSAHKPSWTFSWSLHRTPSSPNLQLYKPAKRQKINQLHLNQSMNINVNLVNHSTLSTSQYATLLLVSLVRMCLLSFRMWHWIILAPPRGQDMKSTGRRCCSMEIWTSYQFRNGPVGNAMTIKVTFMFHWIIRQHTESRTFNNLFGLCAQRRQRSAAVVVIISRRSEIMDTLQRLKQRNIGLG